MLLHTKKISYVFKVFSTWYPKQSNHKQRQTQRQPFYGATKKIIYSVKLETVKPWTDLLFFVVKVKEFSEHQNFTVNTNTERIFTPEKLANNSDT